MVDYILTAISYPERLRIQLSTVHSGIMANFRLNSMQMYTMYTTCKLQARNIRPIEYHLLFSAKEWTWESEILDISFNGL